jgi:predicted NUDIX family phosphoesterase
MDAFELLLRATDRELDPEINISESDTFGKAKLGFDYRDHMNTMLGKHIQ